MNSLKRWRLAGIIAIIVSGFLLHYVYAWTNASKIIGWFAPVNESVWEHLKLGYWSVALFSALEYFQIKYSVHNYYFARLLGVLVLELTIIAIFYSYTFITGKDIFLIDIFSYILAAVLCQYLTYLFLQAKPFSKLVNKISLAAFIAMGVLLGAASYYPPHTALFKDNNSNTYGIHKEK